MLLRAIGALDIADTKPYDLVPTILIIRCDDSAFEQDATALEEAGFAVECCLSEEAFDQLGAADASFSGIVLSMGCYQPIFAPLLRRVRISADPVPVVVLATKIEVHQATCCMRLGASDVIVRPTDAERILTALSAERSKVTTDRPKTGARSVWSDPYGVFDPFPVMKRLVHQIDQVARLDLPVLIIGEAGSGKHAVAMQLYQMSVRSEMPVITVSMRRRDEAAVVADIRAIFGDALSGNQTATPGGTLLLDGIEELGARVQCSLLALLAHRVLSGDNAGRPPLRVLATTEMDLREEAFAGRLKPELYQRLAMLTLAVPSLRERGPDSIRMLAKRFQERVRIKSGEGPRAISNEALEILSQMPWYGNVPQLREVVEAAFLRAIGGEIVEREHVNCAFADLGFHGTEPCQAVVNDWRLRAVERRHIETVLYMTQQNRARAARMLGITRTTLYKKIAEFGLDSE